jgi:hypothetical protein
MFAAGDRLWAGNQFPALTSCVTVAFLCCQTPARANSQSVTDTDDESSDVIGSIELSAGVWDSAFGVKFENGRGFLAEESVSSTLGVVPSIEWPLGRTVFVGAELVLLWIDDPFWRLGERRPLTGLNGRVRLSFPVYEHFTADVLVGTGPAAWSSDPRDGTFYGWSRRLGFGGSYSLNDDLQPYFHVSYYDVNAYAVEGTFDPQPITSGQLVDVSAVLFSVGIRAGTRR